MHLLWYYSLVVFNLVRYLCVDPPPMQNERLQRLHERLNSIPAFQTLAIAETDYEQVRQNFKRTWQAVINGQEEAAQPKLRSVLDYFNVDTNFKQAVNAFLSSGHDELITFFRNYEKTEWNTAYGKSSNFLHELFKDNQNVRMLFWMNGKQDWVIGDTKSIEAQTKTLTLSNKLFIPHEVILSLNSAIQKVIRKEKEESVRIKADSSTLRVSARQVAENVHSYYVRNHRVRVFAAMSSHYAIMADQLKARISLLTYDKPFVYNNFFSMYEYPELRNLQSGQVPEGLTLLKNRVDNSMYTNRADIDSARGQPLQVIKDRPTRTILSEMSEWDFKPIEEIDKIKVRFDRLVHTTDGSTINGIPYQIEFRDPISGEFPKQSGSSKLPIMRSPILNCKFQGSDQSYIAIPSRRHVQSNQITYAVYEASHEGSDPTKWNKFQPVKGVKLNVKYDTPHSGISFIMSSRVAMSVENELQTKNIGMWDLGIDTDGNIKLQNTVLCTRSSTCVFPKTRFISSLMAELKTIKLMYRMKAAIQRFRASNRGYTPIPDTIQEVPGHGYSIQALDVENPSNIRTLTTEDHTFMTVRKYVTNLRQTFQTKFTHYWRSGLKMDVVQGFMLIRRFFDVSFKLRIPEWIKRLSPSKRLHHQNFLLAAQIISTIDIMQDTVFFIAQIYSYVKGFISSMSSFSNLLNSMNKISLVAQVVSLPFSLFSVGFSIYNLIHAQSDKEVDLAATALIFGLLGLAVSSTVIASSFFGIGISLGPLGIPLAIAAIAMMFIGSVFEVFSIKKQIEESMTDLKQQFTTFQTAFDYRKLLLSFNPAIVFKTIDLSRSTFESNVTYGRLRKEFFDSQLSTKLYTFCASCSNGTSRPTPIPHSTKPIFILLPDVPDYSMYFEIDWYLAHTHIADAYTFNDGHVDIKLPSTLNSILITPKVQDTKYNLKLRYILHGSGGHYQIRMAKGRKMTLMEQANGHSSSFYDITLDGDECQSMTFSGQEMYSEGAYYISVHDISRTKAKVSSPDGLNWIIDSKGGRVVPILNFKQYSNCRNLSPNPQSNFLERSKSLIKEFVAQHNLSPKYLFLRNFSIPAHGDLGNTLYNLSSENFHYTTNLDIRFTNTALLIPGEGGNYFYSEPENAIWYNRPTENTYSSFFHIPSNVEEYKLFNVTRNDRNIISFNVAYTSGLIDFGYSILFFKQTLTVYHVNITTKTRSVPNPTKEHFQKAIKALNELAKHSLNVAPLVPQYSPIVSYTHIKRNELQNRGFFVREYEATITPFFEATAQPNDLTLLNDSPFQNNSDDRIVFFSKVNKRLYYAPAPIRLEHKNYYRVTIESSKMQTFSIPDCHNITVVENNLIQTVDFQNNITKVYGFFEQWFISFRPQIASKVRETISYGGRSNYPVFRDPYTVSTGIILGWYIVDADKFACKSLSNDDFKFLGYFSDPELAVFQSLDQLHLFSLPLISTNGFSDIIERKSYDSVPSPDRIGRNWDIISIKVDGDRILFKTSDNVEKQLLSKDSYMITSYMITPYMITPYMITPYMIPSYIITPYMITPYMIPPYMKTPYIITTDMLTTYLSQSEEIYILETFLHEKCSEKPCAKAISLYRQGTLSNWYSYQGDFTFVADPQASEILGFAITETGESALYSYDPTEKYIYLSDGQTISKVGDWKISCDLDHEILTMTVIEASTPVSPLLIEDVQDLVLISNNISISYHFSQNHFLHFSEITLIPINLSEHQTCTIKVPIHYDRAHFNEADLVMKLYFPDSLILQLHIEDMPSLRNTKFQFSHDSLVSADQLINEALYADVVVSSSSE